MTMSPTEIAAFVDRLYAATGVGDWEATAAMLSDDFVAYEADALPMAGAYRGTSGLQTLFQKVMGMVDVIALDRHDLMVGEDCAIAVLSMRFADPALAPAEIAEMFRFRDGKCCEIKPFYYDPAAFISACEAKKATA
ncbi:nuclear transport factor 2 family protein [Novosphingobium album (ex Hu et al. 2023)]